MAKTRMNLKLAMAAAAATTTTAASSKVGTSNGARGVASCSPLPIKFVIVVVIMRVITVITAATIAIYVAYCCSYHYCRTSNVFPF